MGKNRKKQEERGDEPDQAFPPNNNLPPCSCESIRSQCCLSRGLKSEQQVALLFRGPSLQWEETAPPRSSM